MLQPVDERGCYTETPWAGRFVMEDGLDVDIIKYLAADNKIFAKNKLAHNYPHCWRCGTPLVYYAKPSWYIKMSDLKDQLVENNNTVNWFPEFVGEKRFGNWLAEVKDWAISRSRYWGTRFRSGAANAAIWNVWAAEKSWLRRLSRISTLPSSCTDRT